MQRRVLVVQARLSRTCSPQKQRFIGKPDQDFCLDVRMGWVRVLLCPYKPDNTGKSPRPSKSSASLADLLHL